MAALAPKTELCQRGLLHGQELPVVDVHGHFSRALDHLEIRRDPLHETHLLSDMQFDTEQLLKQEAASGLSFNDLLMGTAPALDRCGIFHRRTT
jgi:hypothetical protein